MTIPSDADRSMDGGRIRKLGQPEAPDDAARLEDATKLVQDAVTPIQKTVDALCSGLLVVDRIARAKSIVLGGGGARPAAAGGGPVVIGSGAIQSGMIGDGAVNCGNIASGQVCSGTIADGAVRSGSIGSGQVASGHMASGFIDALGSGILTSGSIQSGNIASGAVQGFFGTTRHIASGTVGVFDFGSGAVVAGTVGSGAVVSANIASGQIGTNHIGSGAIVSSLVASGQIGTNHIASAGVQSGNIGSGQVGQFHVASGAITSGRLGVTGIPDGTLFLRDDFTWAVPALTSGAVQSGHIASGAVNGFFGPTRNINSGTVGVFDFGSGAVIAGAVGSGAVVSANIASGQIGQNHLASGSVTSGAIASGQVGQDHLSSGSVTSGAIASGQVGPFKLSSGAVLSGNTASGAIITYARNVVADRFTCTENISGVRCVIFDPASSGQIQIAMAAVSGRMPAIGVVFENNLSGAICKVVRYGDVVPPAGEMGSGVAFSGRIGKSLWVGASGAVVLVSGGGPRIGVGVTNSGAWGQRIGTSSTSGTILVDVVPFQQFSGAANITTNPLQWPV